MCSSVRGYHEYQRIWTATVGEELQCEKERPRNPRDLYAVVVKKDDIIVGHLPRKISKICSLFLMRGGTLFCVVTGSRRYSADLPQGGLEVPSKLVFSGKHRRQNQGARGHLPPQNL